MWSKVYKRFLIGLVLLASVVLLLVPTTLAGGWAVVTLDRLPAEIVAGKPFQLGFMIRQHGRTPWVYDQVMVHAVSQQSHQKISVKAQAVGDPGHYLATLEFPQAGEWRWGIESGLMPPQQPLPDLTVLDAAQAGQRTVAVAAPALSSGNTSFSWPLGLGLISSLGAIGTFLFWRRTRTPLALAGLTLTLVIGLTSFGLAARASAFSEATPQLPAPPPDSAIAERGRALFIAKGCIVCHRHAAVSEERQRFGSDFADFGVGPDLPTLANDPHLLQAWLKDPPALKPGTAMPNLKLSKAEIEALVAFLLKREPNSAAANITSDKPSP